MPKDWKCYKEELLKYFLIVLFNFLKTRYFQRFKTQEKLRRWQEKKIEKFKFNVLAKSRYYQKFVHKSLSSFPIMDKQKMMENFDNINTTGIKRAEATKAALDGEMLNDFSVDLQGFTAGLSSGTSGNRGLFLVSKEERFKWAGNILAKILPYSFFNKCKIAFFLRNNSNLYTSVKKNSRIKFEFFHLLDDLKQHVDRLNLYQPDLLVAPAQMLKLLAIEQNSLRLNINPTKIVSIAEVLDLIDEKYIQECFGKPVHQIYQCTEGFLGCTCKYGTLHLNEDLIFVEKQWIDKKNRRFSPIITDFTRTSQPIVRYYLNDILIEKKDPCPCGSAFCAIEKIEGRCDDIFYFISKINERPQAVFPDFIRRAIILVSEDILEYHVIQHDFDKIEILLQFDQIKHPDMEKKISENFEKLFEKINVVPPQIEISNNFRSNLSVKLRRIESRLKKDCYDSKK